ncbi:hypothetical protein BGZ49_008936 [Haplosporangium sp. Z 27]|nr:hypothetical protein BGZ49_008936 [Haplosporangium sp. Z 27]
MNPILLPSRQSTISLQDVTLQNWKKISTLVVNKDQLDLVSPNLESLCEHQFHVPHSIVRAIVADNNIPVGYIRLQSQSQSQEPRNDIQQQQQQQEQEQPVFILLSFMIDQKCQGLGFGTKAMLLLQDEIIHHYGCKGIKLFTKPFDSILHQEDSPEHFFAGLSFIKKKDNQGQELMIWTPPPNAQP